MVKRCVLFLQYSSVLNAWKTSHPELYRNRQLIFIYQESTQLEKANLSPASGSEVRENTVLYIVLGLGVGMNNAVEKKFVWAKP